MVQNLEKQYLRVKNEEGREIHDVPIPLSAILREIDEHKWVIPEFQRDFVWDIEKFTLLFDSIYRGYTIGNLLLWKTKEKLAHRKIGENSITTLENTPNSEYTYILDGQQRLTTLYGVLRGKALCKSGTKNPRIYKVYFDIKTDQFVHIDQELKEFEGKTIKDLIESNEMDKFRFVDLSQLFQDDLRYPKNVLDEEISKLDEQLDITLSASEYKQKKKQIELKGDPLQKVLEIFKAYKIHQIVERNEESSTHTVTSNMAGLFDSGDMGMTIMFKHKFTVPGTYDYHCTYHAGMNGKVIVK